MANKLTAKQSLFVKEYLKDLNATQAAIRAGYSENTAKELGYENLTKPYIAKAIEQAQSKRNEKLEIDANYVLRRHMEIDEMDVIDILNPDGGFRPIHDWPKVWRQFISGVDIAELFEGSGDDRQIAGVLKKIKWPDKLRNLELLGKHIGVGAYRENHQMEHISVSLESDAADL